MSEKKLSGQVAVITGGSRGIGRAIGRAFGGQGASVVLAGRDEAALGESAKLICDAGGRAKIVKVDMTDESSLKNLIFQTQKEFGRLDILVNNAGVTHSELLEETSTADYDYCMAVNARGPFILCREAMPLLKQSAKGFIINVSSVVGVKGYPLQSAYGASKHALRGMSIALAEELRNNGENVRVHVICPGGVDTEMVSRVRPDIDKSELIGADEIAELALYLVTHKGNGVVDELHIRRNSSSPWF